MKKILAVLVLASLLLTACQSVNGVVTGTRERVETSGGVSQTFYYVQLDYKIEIEVTERVYSIVSMGDRCTFTTKEPYDNVNCIAPTRKVGDG